MGIETIALVALAGVQGIAGISAARKQAKAGVRQADIQAKNLAQQTQRRAARAKTSFLSSGLTLAGTPAAAISGIFDTGLEDIGTLRSAADARSKNLVSQARTSAIFGLAKAGISGFSGGLPQGAPVTPGNLSGFQFGIGGSGGIPTGGFAVNTGVGNPFLSPIQGPPTAPNF